MSLRSLCNETAYLVTDEGEQNTSTGVYQPDFEDSGDRFLCHLQPVSTPRRMQYMQEGLDISHICYFEQSTVITVDQRFKHENLTYRVMFVEEPTRPGWPGKALVQRVRR